MACNIKPGATGENVTQLQRFLKVVKQYTGKIDGQYGNFTKIAVKSYQKRHGLYPDGQAGCKTTTYMKLQCALHDCDKPAPKKPLNPIAKPKTTPTIVTPVPQPTPTLPPPSKPNYILPDHTVSIDNIGFYAENPELVEPFQRKIYDKIEIDNGPPRFYPTGTHNREMNFKVTLIQKLPATPYPNFQKLLNFIKPCEGIHKFSSIYMIIHSTSHHQNNRLPPRYSCSQF